MYARGNRLYGLIFAGAVLLAGCSGDDMPAPAVTPATEPVAIAFDCTLANDGDADGTGWPAGGTPSATRGSNGHTGIINDENKELYYTGFGTFATQTLVTPDLMYNQEVAFTFFDNEPDKGYWTYSPLKYWPTDLTNVALCAYAPYVPKPAIDPQTDTETTGIIGMSANTERPYILYRRCLHPEDNVDLLWGTCTPNADMTNPQKRTPAKMTMHHALARMRVNITLSGTTTKKVLLKGVTLSGEMAETGRLELTTYTESATGKRLPVWSGQQLSARTIVISNNPESVPASYGIIKEGVRYIDDLPARWQPAGMAKGTDTDILYMSEYPSFVYLIPQESLSLTARIDYVLIDGSNNVTEGWQRTDGAVTIGTLNGNTTYHLSLKLKIDD